MKRLILIQNDYSGAGKSTLTQSLHHYLTSFQVPHHTVVLAESASDSVPHAQIEAKGLNMDALNEQLEKSNLIIMEVESDLTQHFNKFYEKNELDHELAEMNFELTVVVPVTSEVESFDGVLAAAETFSENAQYLIVHTPTSSFYEDDTKLWDKSYAARVMDMFEATDMQMPVCDHSLTHAMKARHTDLPEALQSTAATDEVLYNEVSRWFRKVTGNLDSVRKYLFGDAFRPAVAVKAPAAEPAKKVRKSRHRELDEAMAAA
jgi:hypothetical protein